MMPSGPISSAWQPPGLAAGPGFAIIEIMLKMSLQNMGQLIKTIATAFPAQAATLSSLSIANSSLGGTTVSTKTIGGYLMAVSVTTPSTGTVPGKIYDANSPTNVGSSNILALIPSSGMATFVYPYFAGLTIQPSSVSSQVVSVYFI